MFGVDEFERIRKEADVIRAAPVSFCIVLLICVGLLWEAYHLVSLLSG
jgi:hypothetical protein